MMGARRTKIVATLGPASDSPEVLDRLLGVGVDCVRMNCSHGEVEQLRARARAARAAAERAGRPLALLFDLQGPKLRLSAATPPRTVQTGTSCRSPAAQAAGEHGRCECRLSRLLGARDRSLARSWSVTACRGSRSNAEVTHACSAGPVLWRAGRRARA